MHDARTTMHGEVGSQVLAERKEHLHELSIAHSSAVSSVLGRKILYSVSLNALQLIASITF